MQDPRPDDPRCMTKAPAFQFYPRDWLSDTRVAAMSLEERGAYITLLCYAWTDGGIPTDPQKLARILGVDVRYLKKLWKSLADCWQANGHGSFVNPRLERERQKQADFRKAASRAGKASAAKRLTKANSEGALNER